MLFLLLAFLRLENTFPVVFLSMSTVDAITEISTQPLGYFSKCMHHFWKLLNFQIYDTENLSHWSTVQIHYGEGSENTAAALLESISTCSALTWGSSPEGRRVLSHWTSQSELENARTPSIAAATPTLLKARHASAHIGALLSRLWSADEVCTSSKLHTTSSLRIL